MEQDSCSMTPPNSPILQAGLFEEDMVIPDDPVITADNLKSHSTLLCCQGEPQSYSSTHSDGLLHQGIIERLQTCSLKNEEISHHLVTLFDHQFDIDTAFTLHRQTVFCLARSTFSKMEDISEGANFVHVGDSSVYVKLRKDVRSFFDYFIQWLKYKKRSVTEPNIPALLEELLLLSVFVGRLHDLPNTVLSQAASRQGNKSSAVSCHYFHLCLEMHCVLIEAVYTLTVLRPEAVVNNINLCACQGDSDMIHDPVTELIQLLLWDLVALAINTHNKMSSLDYQRISPFSCSCVREVTIFLIQLMALRQQKQAKQSFWVCLTSILLHIINPQPSNEEQNMEIDSYSTVLPFAVECRDPVGFSWWFVLHVKPLYNYNHLGIYSQSQVPTPSNYYLIQQLIKRSITMNEDKLRLHLRCCLGITSDWETNANFVSQLWEHFYKKLNESFRMPTSDLMGHACIQKSAASLYENCQRLAENNIQGLNQDSSFQLFLRILAQYLTKSDQPHQAWRQVKGRFYSKFHARRVQELTDVGLQNLVTLFIVLGYLTDTQDISGKLVELLLMVRDLLTAARQAAVWRGMFALVHLHQHKDHNAGYITEKLAAGFEPIARELCECTDVSQVSTVWGLVSLYLDSTTDLLEVSVRLSHQEYMLIGPALHALLSRANTTELKTLLSFVLAAINKLRSLSMDVADTHIPHDPGVLGLSDRLWLHSYSFISQHSTTQTPPSLLADVASGFCLLALNMPPTIQTGMKEDFTKVITYFSVGTLVNPVISCRFLCQTLAISEVEDVISRAGDEQEINLIHAWFRCHWYLLNQSESLQQLTRLLIPRLDCILRDAGSTVRDLPVICQFFVAIGVQYASLQDLRSKMEFRDRVERYFGDVGKHISAVMKNCGSSALIKNIYFLAGHLVKHCAALIYSNMKPNCLLPPLVDRLILPRSLVVQGKELPESVIAALKEHLHLFVSGFGCLDYRADAYIQRKLKEMFTIYFTKFQMSATVAMSASHVHPFVAAVCDDSTPFRQYILQMVTQEHLSGKTCSTQGLQFVLELFRKSKTINTARDSVVLLSPLLTQLVENSQHKSHLSHVVCGLLEAKRLHSQLLNREELVKLVAMVIEKQVPVHQGRVFRSMEGTVHAHTQLFVDLIPTMTGAVRLSEMKRGLGKDKQLRVAYCGLLQKLGDPGTAEKSKMLTAD